MCFNAINGDNFFYCFHFWQGSELLCLFFNRGTHFFCFVSEKEKKSKQNNKKIHKYR